MGRTLDIYTYIYRYITRASNVETLSAMRVWIGLRFGTFISAHTNDMNSRERCARKVYCCEICEHPTFFSKGAGKYCIAGFDSSVQQAQCHEAS